jgi:hypothetical protein
LARLADIERATRDVAALVLQDEVFAPIFDRLTEELERARKGSARDKAREYLRATGDVR